MTARLCLLRAVPIVCAAGLAFVPASAFAQQPTPKPETPKPDAKPDAKPEEKPEAKPAAPTRREPTPGEVATARDALREGVDLRLKGDLEGALGRLTTAYEL